MLVQTQIYIHNHPNLYRYLRENSYWYKYLNRSPLFLKEVEEEMKNRYKLTTKDKMEKFSNRLDMIASVMDILS